MSSRINTREKILEWAAWYGEHRNDSMGVENRLAFQQKMIEGLLDCIALVFRDLQDARGIPKSKQIIWLPNEAQKSIQLNG